MWKMTITQMKKEYIGEKPFDTLQTVEIVAENLASLSVIGEQLLATSKKALRIQFEKVAADEING